MLLQDLVWFYFFLVIFLQKKKKGESLHYRLHQAWPKNLWVSMDISVPRAPSNMHRTAWFSTRAS